VLSRSIHAAEYLSCDLRQSAWLLGSLPGLPDCLPSSEAFPTLDDHVAVERIELHQEGIAAGPWLAFCGRSASTSPDGAVEGIARDTTEQRKAEEALAASEHVYRTLFETAGDGFAILK
jgi:PAS domain-containing protein